METLLQQTLRLLKESNQPLSDICRGTGVKQRWLYRLIAGDYLDPGVNKIEALHNYLTANRKGAA